jgi:hypothetical protein
VRTARRDRARDRPGWAGYLRAEAPERSWGTEGGVRHGGAASPDARPSRRTQ